MTTQPASTYPSYCLLYDVRACALAPPREVPPPLAARCFCAFRLVVWCAYFTGVRVLGAYAGFRALRC